MHLESTTMDQADIEAGGNEGSGLEQSAVDNVHENYMRKALAMVRIHQKLLNPMKVGLTAWAGATSPR